MSVDAGPNEVSEPSPSGQIRFGRNRLHRGIQSIIAPATATTESVVELSEGVSQVVGFLASLAQIVCCRRGPLALQIPVIMVHHDAHTVGRSRVFDGSRRLLLGFQVTSHRARWMPPASSGSRALPPRQLARISGDVLSNQFFRGARSATFLQPAAIMLVPRSAPCVYVMSLRYPISRTIRQLAA
jgi:hypothetical protein